MRTYYVSLRDGRTGGVDVEGNRIVAVPPIWNGWKGQSFSRFCAYYKSKGDCVEVTSAQENNQKESGQEVQQTTLSQDPCTKG